MRGLIRFAAAVAVGVASLFGAGQAIAAGAAGRQTAAPQTSGRLVYQGAANLRALAVQGSALGSNFGGNSPVTRVSPLKRKAEQGPIVPVPNPPSTAVLSQTGGAPGFLGLTAADSAAVNGFPVEPPDQGLCAHDGLVLEGVNLALRVFSESGAPVTAGVSLNAFFGLAPAVSTSDNQIIYGPFVSDPRCYYDAQTGRWIVTALRIDINPKTGNFGDRSSELIAVSKTSDPTGDYGLFSFDTTNDGEHGTPREPNCPCFGDQPRIGADANGFYISTDSYPINGTFNSNGGELYAISKPALAAAASGAASAPTRVAIHVGAVTIGGYPANAVQPAETPQGASDAVNREYFLSTPDFNGFATMGGAGARAVVFWTLSNTSSLAGATPALRLTDAIVPSEPYVPPVNATQKPGPRPLGESLKAPPPPLSANDDRMQQVQYLNGQVFSSLNTGVGPNGTADRSGVAWFAVTPTRTGGVVSHQGYLAASDGTSLLYPSIGLDQNGLGAMAFSVSGPAYYPSAAYVLLNPAAVSSPIYRNGPGALPEDGFTCYTSLGFGPACRWGDYSAATSDGNHHIVMGAEMIPNTVRDPQANWGTFLSTLYR